MTRQRGVALAAAALVASVLFVMPANAAAHGRHGGGVYVGGHYGFAPYYGMGWGWGWGPYFWPPYGPYSFGANGGVDPGAAMIAGFGAVDVDAKPNQADVWADGKYVGEARDLDGYPSLLWLKEGEHTIAIYKGGYRTFEEKIDVQRGMQTKLKVRLEKGESEPPGLKPGERPKPTEPSRAPGATS
jgi:hypothetical protein